MKTQADAAIERSIVLPAAISVPAAGKKTDKDAAAALAAWVKRIDDDQDRWAFLQQQAAANHTPLNQWNGLTAPWKAQSSYFARDKAKELRFWL